MGLFKKTASGSSKSAVNSTKPSLKEAMNVPKTAQDSIPYMGVYENGIIQVKDNLFSKMYEVPEINFKTKDNEQQTDIFEKFMGTG